MNAIAIIPARFEASRLPGKLILQEAKDVTGKYIIEHVYHNTCRAKKLKQAIIATDDKRIYDIVKQFGGAVAMTPDNINSGTDRAAWVVENVDSIKDLNPDIVVNVQGDEPDLPPEAIDSVVELLNNDELAVMSTIANPIESEDEFLDPNAVKVTLDNMGYALYFSRASIPYTRNPSETETGAAKYNAFKHIGLYAYKKDFLVKYSSLPPSKLEEIECLEQLRAISNGHKIKVAIEPHNSIGIDTKNDFERFLDRYR